MLKILKRRWLLILLVLPVCLAVLWFGASFIRVGPRPVTHGSADQPMIALTFDDGPNAGYTSQILQILDRYQVKGTFFVIGENVERHPEIAREIALRGHQIGNHSHSHSDSLPYLLPNQIANDSRKARKAIREATGLEPRFYRAPHGRFSPWMSWALRREGFVLTGWYSSPKDWKDPGVEKLIDRVVDNAARSGSIIDLHDGLGLEENADRSQLVQALPSIIEQLQAQGYRFVTVADLLGEEPYF